MPVVFQERFEKKLREWSSQPDPNPQDYGLFPIATEYASLKVNYIDGLLWKTYPQARVDYVAGRFRKGDLERKWIVLHEDMKEIPGGKFEVEKLESALRRLGVEKLGDMAVETKASGQTYVAITVSTIARRLLDNNATALAGSSYNNSSLHQDSESDGRITPATSALRYLEKKRSLVSEVVTLKMWLDEETDLVEENGHQKPPKRMNLKELNRNISYLKYRLRVVYLQKLKRVGMSDHGTELLSIGHLRARLLYWSIVLQRGNSVADCDKALNVSQ